MTENGCRIEKGRGIAFEDDKHVRTKGSEIGYPLATIDKALDRNRLMQNEQSLQQLKAHFKKPDRSASPLKENQEEEQRQELHRGRRIGR